jgi:hypothetical protein
LTAREIAAYLAGGKCALELDDMHPEFTTDLAYARRAATDHAEVVFYLGIDAWCSWFCRGFADALSTRQMP